MGAPVVPFEIMGGEGQQLERCYGDLLSWESNSDNPMKYGVVDTQGGTGGIDGGIGPARHGGRRVSIYARVGDLQATVDQGEKLGGETILPPTEVSGVPKLAVFADPSGNVTGVVPERQAA